jgi:hypothetical protein
VVERIVREQFDAARLVIDETGHKEGGMLWGWSWLDPSLIAKWTIP